MLHLERTFRDRKLGLASSSLACCMCVPLMGLTAGYSWASAGYSRIGVSSEHAHSSSRQIWQNLLSLHISPRLNFTFLNTSIVEKNNGSSLNSCDLHWVIQEDSLAKVEDDSLEDEQWTSRSDNGQWLSRKQCINYATNRSSHQRFHGSLHTTAGAIWAENI